ncbi:MAG: hypothetical protein SFU86_01650 [Pirellulaceae bacterium]|nr:hypothetical protein [Pirellulaceae bacterium]
MTLASPEVIGNRLLAIGLRYVGLALAFLLFAGSGFVFMNVRWLARGSLGAIVVLVAAWLVSWGVLAAVRRSACQGYGILVGLAVAFSIGIGLLGVAIDPAPREWTIRAWETVGGPPAFILRAAVGKWEDAPTRRMILGRLAREERPCETIVPVVASALRGQATLTSDSEREICRQAIMLLENCGDKAAPAVPELAAVAADPESGWMAADVLAEVGPPAKAAVPALLKVLREHKESSAAYALLRIAPDEHAREAAEVLATNLLSPTLQYVAWSDLKTLPPRPEIRAALENAAKKLPAAPPGLGSKEELITGLFVHHLLFKQGGSNFTELQGIAGGCFDFNVYDSQLHILSMYQSPPEYALQVLDDLGIQAAPLLVMLENFESYLRSLPRASEADRVARIIKKVRSE